jgi:hypothetical protein
MSGFTMNIRDYLLEQTDKDWSALLSDWAALLPANEFTVWLVNRFGDVVMVLNDGTVHMLDVGAGKLERLAGSRDEFAARLDEGDNADLWLLISLTDACIAKGLRLGTSQCYGWKVPPLLGGKYDVENVEPTDLVVHYGLLADIWRQTKDLPDGTPINAVLGD